MSKIKKIIIIVMILLIISALYYIYFLFLRPTSQLDTNQTNALIDSLPKDNDDFIANSITGKVISISDNQLSISGSLGEADISLTNKTVYRQSNADGLFIITDNKLELGKLVTIYYSENNSIKEAKTVDIINLK